MLLGFARLAGNDATESHHEALHSFGANNHWNEDEPPMKYSRTNDKKTFQRCEGSDLLGSNMGPIPQDMFDQL